MTNPIWEYKACAPPRCECPTIQSFNDDGVYRVQIDDDYNNAVCMTVDEFALIARRFIQVYETGAYDAS